MTIEDWHKLLDRYWSTAANAQEEYSQQLDEFEVEHGFDAREKYEEAHLV